MRGVSFYDLIPKNLMNEMQICIHLLLFPACGCSETSYLSFLLPLLTHHVKSSLKYWTKISLSPLGCFGQVFLLEYLREVTNTYPSLDPLMLIQLLHVCHLMLSWLYISRPLFFKNQMDTLINFIFLLLNLLLRHLWLFGYFFLFWKDYFNNFPIFELEHLHDWSWFHWG